MLIQPARYDDEVVLDAEILPGESYEFKGRPHELVWDMDLDDKLRARVAALYLTLSLDQSPGVPFQFQYDLVTRVGGLAARWDQYDLGWSRSVTVPTTGLPDYPIVSWDSIGDTIYFIGRITNTSGAAITIKGKALAWIICDGDK